MTYAIPDEELLDINITRVYLLNKTKEQARELIRPPEYRPIAAYELGVKEEWIKDIPPLDYISYKKTPEN